ncbi:MAG: Nre family DNA repair protein [Metallosphaera sp.]
MRKIPAELCVRCKGTKFLCGLTSCPITERFRAIVNSTSKISLEKGLVDGSTPPSAVVGEKGYPRVSISLNVAPGVIGDLAKVYEDPVNWWGKASIYDIINFRSSLISNISSVKVTDVWKLYEKELSLAVVSEKPVRSETKISGKLEPKLKFDGYVMPRGPAAKAEEIKIVENPKVSKALEKLIHDDVKSNDGILTLYRNGESIYSIIDALSLGLMGVRKDRKLVPTRWAITAVDSALGKELRNRVVEKPQINEVTIFYQSYLGNNFHVILYPSSYSISWVEIWHEMGLWSTDMVITDLREDYWGKYDTLDGGYMAARTSVLEYLDSISKSAGVIIIREITKDYFAPLGNWHIRETVKRSFQNKIAVLNSLVEAIDLVQSRLKEPKVRLKEVRAIKEVLNQSRIDSFFRK